MVSSFFDKPSEAAEYMEIGCKAVLVNTAATTADDPTRMAKAFVLAVEAGRKADLAEAGTEPHL